MPIDKHLMVDGDTIYWDENEGCWKAKQVTIPIIHSNQFLTRTVNLDITSIKDTYSGNNSTVVAGITLDKIHSVQFSIVNIKRFYDPAHSDTHLRKIKQVIYTDDIDNQGKSNLEAETIEYMFTNTVNINDEQSFVFLSMIRNSNEPTSFIIQGMIQSGDNKYTGADTVNIKCKITYKPPSRDFNR